MFDSYGSNYIVDCNCGPLTDSYLNGENLICDLFNINSTCNINGGNLVLNGGSIVCECPNNVYGKKLYSGNTCNELKIYERLGNTPEFIDAANCWKQNFYLALDNSRPQGPLVSDIKKNENFK